MPKVRMCVCGGSWVQHQDDEQGCWCPTCLLDRTPEDRCQEFREVMKPSKPSVRRNVVPVGHDHPATSQQMKYKKLPQSGTRRAQVYAAILRSQMRGMTSDEVEWEMTLPHQTASSTVNTLMNDGLIKDSGQTRKTRYGNDAIVWVVDV